jgi:hypothetical protein
MTLVRVWTDVGTRKPVPLLARIEEKDGVIFTIRYLSETSKGIWSWEDDTYEIDDDSIAEYLKTDLLEDIGFRSFGDEGSFIKCESDDDYIPDTSDEEEETDETDSDDEETDDSGSFEDDEEESDEDEEESLDEE